MYVGKHRSGRTQVALTLKRDLEWDETVCLLCRVAGDGECPTLGWCGTWDLELGRRRQRLEGGCASKYQHELSVLVSRGLDKQDMRLNHLGYPESE